ncbi:helix-turn-helix domain-containing protein [Pediococcus pentosaceus]|uniref:helix-turn-helix domain-containing protein n=1 Tax=Pediococcus pentosaceus TaxID=1255 RepID=UPI002072EC56|nr:helix-turn-helix transcriptional regulator [Pediococcus pentosaceus]MCM6810357.1 helix-turn-helix domain-containing protein [Pediococcus pentosaceus]
MNAGTRLAYLRNKKGMSQPQLAEKLSVSQSTIAMWESNKRKISAEDIVRLADLFAVTTDYLLGRQPKDDGLLVAAHMDDDLTDEQKKEIEEYIEFKKAQYRKQHEKD